MTAHSSHSEWRRTWAEDRLTGRLPWPRGRYIYYVGRPPASPDSQSCIEREQAGDAFEQCRFAGAVRPNQAEDLAAENAKRYVGEHPLIAKGLADPLYGHQGVGVR